MGFDFPTEILEEGCVRFLAPKLEAFKRAVWEYAPSKAPVFYNPMMELNRDLAVLALQAYQRTVQQKLVVCEPLAGCGVRGIRFAKEVEGIRRVLMNDINPVAAEMARYNVGLNSLSRRVFVLNEEANLLLSRYAAPRKRFDFVDIDPFGAPVPYLDTALRALRDGGLIALTATDMAPLCGVYPKVALRKYGGKSLRTEYCHEVAIRLLAGCLASTAARHNIGLRLLFSHSTDHYIRVYARSVYGAEKADRTIQNLGYMLHCFNCFHREIHRGLIPTLTDRCSECGSRLEAAGPLWLGKLSDRDFCSLMEREIADRRLGERKRAMRLLSLVIEESEGPATYYVVDKICDRFGLSVPPLKDVLNKIKEVGFKAFPTHFNNTGVKTDAPARVVIDTIKELSRSRGSYRRL
ncbi:MAG: tRNA (guanine(10)-N(2))-dimethyltransferase [Candidatus Bathyarchaeia archaeon]